MDKSQLALSQAIDGYFIAAHARRLSEHTLRDYDTTFRRFETFLGRDPPLASLTRHDIRRFLNSLEGLSDKTVLNYHTGLSALWTWAVEEHLVDTHIVRQVAAPKPEIREIVPYTRRDVEAMLAACDRSRPYTRPCKRKHNHARPTALRDRAIIKLLVDTGMRASELCSLQIPDLDLKNETLVVMGKGDKERLLRYAPSTGQAVWRYLTTRDDAKRYNAPLFLTSRGTPLNRDSLRHLITRIGQRAGVRRATCHRFRHTFAIEFLRNYPNAYALQAMLGHTTLDMVKRYLMIAQTDLEEAHRIGSPVANWGL